MLVNPAEVRHAIESNAIEPCFQPVVDLRSARLTGFEVLTRWRHPTLGLVLPKNFIQVAEELGIIGILTRQILRRAFRCATILPGRLTLAINVSPIQLRFRSLPMQIREAAEEAGLPLQRLIIEVTESAILDNEEMALSIAHELKEMGCGLALDDFGTGYASMRHLVSLPFDQIKVDRSFISEMETRPESCKIVAAVVGLGRNLGLNTLAEGVESREQESILIQMGCSLGQGWLYGRPLAADQIPMMVAAPDRDKTSGLAAVLTKKRFAGAV
ncbi:MAG TPA: EAL domain-containing protein [Acidobacteriaceae bacterium]|jgi:EAL domain-containing protein (putative c-di-GMP-specific phosphodiesterase class I)|nr:EAL domain-containing protein [Acidobacteriaceae bacterium]